MPLIAGVDEVIDLLGRAVVTDRRHSETVPSVDAIAKSIRSRRPGTPTDLAVRLDNCWPLHPVTAVVLGPMSGVASAKTSAACLVFSRRPNRAASRISSGLNRQLPANCSAPTGFGTIYVSTWSPRSWHRTTAIAGRKVRMRSSAARLEVRPFMSGSLNPLPSSTCSRNGSGLAADRATLAACIPDASDGAIDAVAADLERWSVAVFRKHLDAWSIYAGSDFDIDGAVSSAAAQASALDLNRLARLAGLQPVLAKRHYHETGSLRWFQTELVHLRSWTASRTVPAMPPGISSWQSHRRMSSASRQWRTAAQRQK